MGSESLGSAIIESVSLGSASISTGDENSVDEILLNIFSEFVANSICTLQQYFSKMCVLSICKVTAIKSFMAKCKICHHVLFDVLKTDAFRMVKFSTAKNYLEFAMKHGGFNSFAVQVVDTVLAATEHYH